MKFFFWNINKHDLSDLIVSFIITENVDVAIFAEASEMDFASLQIKLNGKYRLLGFNEFPGKVRFLVKSNIRAFEFMDAQRYSIGTFSLGSSLINIVGVHLPDRSSDPYGSGREYAAREIMEELNERELRFEHASNVIIGDFNASPFDHEMIKATSFNATLYSEVACRLKRRRTRFTNSLLCITLQLSLFPRRMITADHFIDQTVPTRTIGIATIRPS